jgi:hypothetical protein
MKKTHLLTDGSVLIVGGYKELYPIEAVASAELYQTGDGGGDVTVGVRRVPLRPLSAVIKAAPARRTRLMRTLIAYSKGLVFAGVGLLVSPLFAVAQPVGKIVSAGKMNAVRRSPRATLLTDGRVLITGSAAVMPTPGGGLMGAELYDPAIGAFWPLETPTIWVWHSSTLLPDGNVLIAGGAGLGGGASARAYVFFPDDRSFVPVGDMTSPRAGHTATLLNNGKVLLAGGEAHRGPPMPTDVTAELYDPQTRSFLTTGTFVGAGTPVVASSTLLADGKVLTIGFASGVAALYDPATEMFSPPTASSAASFGRWLTQWHSAATLLASGKVLLVGGIEGWGPDAHAETYDPGTGLFTPEHDMTTARWGASATLLSDGTALVAGGGNRNTAEVYDPDARVFTETANMSEWKIFHSATLLQDGNVLLAGGGDCWECPPSQTADIYVPSVVRPAVALLSAPFDPGGRGAILHANSHQEVTADNPAVAGEALEIYGSGLVEGSVIPPRVTIDGRMAEVLWFGPAPGLNAVSQVNVRVPEGITAGPHVPVLMHYMGRISNAVSVPIQ